MEAFFYVKEDREIAVRGGENLFPDPQDMPGTCSERKNMSNLEFGLTLTVFGMGGTLVILFLISLVVDVLNKCLPYKEDAKK